MPHSGQLIVFFSVNPFLHKPRKTQDSQFVIFFVDPVLLM